MFEKGAIQRFGWIQRIVLAFFVIFALLGQGSTATLAATSSWTPQTLPSSNTYVPSSIAYGQNGSGQGLWVAVENDGVISTSPDGTTWTATASPIDPNYTTYFNGVTYGNNEWVIVGQSGELLTSTNGTNWTKQKSNTTSNLYGITYGNGTFVAVSQGGKIITSTDGTNWTAHAVPGSFEAIAYGNNQFVAVGDSGIIYTSANGTTWTSQTSHVSGNLYGVAYGEGQYVAVGQAGTMLTSTNGITWNAQTSGTPYDLYGVAYGAGKFVAVGFSLSGGLMVPSSLTIISSTNGSTWHAETPGGSLSSNANFDCVAYGDSQFVIGGDNSGPGIFQTQSTNANLSNLTVSQGNLSPAFASGTMSYTLNEPYTVTSLKMTPTLADSTATMTVNGSAATSGTAIPVSLKVGSNMITVVVSAQDGTTTKTYTITVARAAPSSNANLSNLTVSQGNLSPAFASGTMSYTLNEPYTLTSLKVTPTLADSTATMKVNGLTVTSGSASNQISLNVGTNSIKVVVTAQDGTTHTYIITVTRLVAMPTGLVARDTTTMGTTLVWNPVTDATSYNLYENGKMITSTANTFYQVNGLKSGTTYTFTVSAVGIGGESPQSSMISVNTASIRSVGILLSRANVLSGTSVTVSGVVYDVYHKPVSYAVVNLSSPFGSFGGSSTVKANVYGFFSAIWTAPSVTSKMTTTVTASVYGTVYGAVSNVQSTTISVNVAPPPTIVTTTLPGGIIGTSFSQSLDAAGGFAPYSWTVTKGVLPNGLTLDANAGVISGIPTTTGTSYFTVQVTDAAGNIATQVLSITVSEQVSRSGSGSSSNNGGTSNPSNNYFGTVVQNVNMIDGIPVTINVQGSEVTLHTENAPISGNSISVTTQNLDSISKITTNLPITANVTSAVGVHYSGTGFPMTVTLSNPAIRIGSAVDEWVNGQLVQVPATVVNGKVTLQISKDTNIVVVSPLPMLLYPNQREIAWNGQTYGYYAFVQKDPNTGVRTTYMPIWYVMQMLKNAGIQSRWNGHTWTMTTSGVGTLTGSGSGLSQKGNMTITLDGQVSEQVPGEVRIDPAHGNKTTYMPIWYVMQILKEAGITSDWTGKMWALYPTDSPTTQQ